MSSRSRGINHCVTERFGADHPNARREYALGDVNTTLVQTARGLTVTLYHDTQSPRPHDLILQVQGARGQTPVWEAMDEYHRQYEHPVWQTLGRTAKQYPHGPADYLVLQQFVQAVRSQVQTPIDVYDAATWSVITSLTEQSVAAKSAAVDFPDFTRGKWATIKPLEMVA